jgi:hypothetical protein
MAAQHAGWTRLQVVRNKEQKQLHFPKAFLRMFLWQRTHLALCDGVL